MAKSAKRGSKENPVTFNQVTDVLNDLVDKKPFVIKEASIKDDFCNYSYEITNGIGLGDTHGVKGKGIIEEDMRKAFALFNVHLAAVDDIFKHAGVEITDIDMMHGDQFATLYSVTGFKVKGSDDNESIVLIGNKYVSSCGGRIELESPRIPIDSTSSYKWYNELKEVADKARLEVELYKGGKYTVADPPEEKEDFKQAKMVFTDANDDNDENDLSPKGNDEDLD